jgi:response regulator NasT
MTPPLRVFSAEVAMTSPLRVFSAEVAMTSPLRVVIADDERDTREYLHELLTRLGHQVAVAESGRQLLDLCRRFGPNLVITDIKMPDGDGIEAARQIGQERDVPVILVSAYHDPALLERAASEPIMGYLVKPIKQADLEAAMAVALRRFEQLRSARGEAASLRKALEERKVVERAKGVVMRRLRVDEEEGYRRLRKLASDRNLKLPEVAQAVLRANEIFESLEGV